MFKSIPRDAKSMFISKANTNWTSFFSLVEPNRLRTPTQPAYVCTNKDSVMKFQVPNMLKLKRKIQCGFYKGSSGRKLHITFLNTSVVVSMELFFPVVQEHATTLNLFTVLETLFCPLEHELLPVLLFPGTTTSSFVIFLICVCVPHINMCKFMFLTY